MRPLYFIENGKFTFSRKHVIKSCYSEYDGKECPVEFQVQYKPTEEGVSLLVCYGHDNEIFEDDDTLQIKLTDILDAACVWGEGEFCKNNQYYTHKLMATYLRSLAELYDFKAQDFQEAKIKNAE